MHYQRSPLTDFQRDQSRIHEQYNLALEQQAKLAELKAKQKASIPVIQEPPGEKDAFPKQRQVG